MTDKKFKRIMNLYIFLLNAGRKKFSEATSGFKCYIINSRFNFVLPVCFFFLFSRFN